MIHTPEFWVFIAFLILVGLGGKKGWSLLIEALDHKAKIIKRDLDEAAQLKEETQALLEKQKQLHAEAIEKAKEIITHAYKEAERLKKEAHEAMEIYSSNEERLLEERVQLVEQLALQEIKTRIIEMSLDETQKTIEKSFDPQLQSQIINQMINALENKIPSKPPVS
jgi:F-type H+-transporting ATPase subunit b